MGEERIMKYDLVLKDALIRDGFTSWEGDLAVEGEKIAALGRGLAGKKEIPVHGKWLLPGILDVHTHMSLPFAKAVSADDFFTGTRAGAFGGVTTIIDFTSHRGEEGLKEGFKRRLAEAKGKAVVDFSFHACIGRFNSRVEADLEWARDHGITSLKMFTAYKKAGLMMDDGILYQAIAKASRYGILPTVHAESGHLIDYLIDSLAAFGKSGIDGHVLSHPVFSETEAVQRVCTLAANVGSPLYIVHVSCGDSAGIIGEWKRRGANIFGETCPQYLILSEELLTPPAGHLFASTPPIRPKAQIPGLIAGLKSNDLSVLATDHCPFTIRDKNTWGGDFRQIPMGLPGIETLLPLSLWRGQEKGLPTDLIIRALTVNPAKLFGLYPRKGTLQPGADADFVIFHPGKKVSVTSKKLHMALDYSPYEGMKVTGWPEMTFLRGQCLVAGGKFHGTEGQGKFLPRGLPRFA